MSEAEQNRSERPTPFKLARAREKGTVARGMDLGYLTALAAFAGYCVVAGPDALARVAHGAEDAIVTAPNVLATPGAMIALVGSLMNLVARPLAFLGGTVFVIVLVFELVQTGFVFSTQPLKPDFSRLNPAKGFKRVFSKRILVETGKSVLKLAVYVALTALVIRHVLRVDLAAVADAQHLAASMRDAALRLLWLFVGGAAFFAILDQLIVRREFLANMRMSPREIRRESRDREGEPRLKQRRKRLHREFVEASQSLRGVRSADVLITNPTHFAVALRYDPTTMEAPLIVSQGQHRFALRLRRLAFAYGVEIIENKALARALHACPLGRPIPDELFRAVADIYMAMRDRKRQKTGARAVV